MSYNEPLVETIHDSRHDILGKIDQELGTTNGSWWLGVSQLRKIAARMGLSAAGNRDTILHRIREHHPELDEANANRRIGKGELREIHASLTSGEVIGDE